MDYEDQKKAIAVIKKSMAYVKQVHNEAEARHDSYGEYYMDGVQYEIMQETEAILDEATRIIGLFENS